MNRICYWKIERIVIVVVGYVGVAIRYTLLIHDVWRENMRIDIDQGKMIGVAKGNRHCLLGFGIENTIMSVIT